MYLCTDTSMQTHTHEHMCTWVHRNTQLCSVLPQATEAWAEKDVFLHLKATGVFMKPRRGERHYNKRLHV